VLHSFPTRRSSDLGDGKKFHQFRPNGQAGVFVFGAPDAPRPLYNRTRLATRSNTGVSRQFRTA
jgi:hypothetical protein